MADIPTPETARDAFAVWRNAFPVDPYAADLHLAAVNRRYLDGEALAEIDADMGALSSRFAELASQVDAYQAHPPRLESWDGRGNRVDRVRFDGAYHDAGVIVWGTGMLAHGAAPGGSFAQANLGYLISLEGEMGHMCAAICTNGVVRVLRWAGERELLDRFEGLTSADASTALRGAQYLTEVQGGSDVGANALAAAARPDGTYALNGEKWFCSVADADVFLVMARPDGAPTGTPGLGCFLAPREIDGRLNGIQIRRLKDKLGTVSMASGEIDFVDAVAYPVGALDAGFKLMVSGMLNTSRWLNAVGNVGILRRAYLEAEGYAAHRVAFGRTIGEFPAVRALLASIKVEWLAALHSTWALTSLDDRVDHAQHGEAGDPEDALFHRFLVNANKFVVSQACTSAVRSAIEVLGGNGAIEDFSVLPRLLRDSVVYEQWEGTHNVLVAQVARDMQRLDLLPVVVRRIEGLVARTGDADLVSRPLKAAQAVAERAAADAGFAAWHFREVLVALLRCIQVALLLDAAEDEPELSHELRAAARLLAADSLEPGYTPSGDPSYPDLVEAVLGSDV